MIVHRNNKNFKKNETRRKKENNNRGNQNELKFSEEKKNLRKLRTDRMKTVKNGPGK